MANHNDVKKAIEAGDTELLKGLLLADPARANANIEWGPDGKNVVPPLHYCCDAVFLKLCTESQALLLANELIGAGVDIHQSDSKSGDTFLIAAASLGAELIGLRLVELGAYVRAQGLFGATALHWAAFMGLPRLSAALVKAGAPTDLEDKTNGKTPLGWAEYAWNEGCNGYRDRVPACAELLGGSVGDDADASGP